MVAGLPPERRPFQFFGWVALLSVPFYLLGWLAPELKRWMPVQFPISALMVVAPLFAAGLLTWRSEGQTGVRRLLSRTFDAKRVQHKGWLLVAFGSCRW
ncbi:hypothetical protein [Deinococcus piscis]|uniref:hypothetical protein n=1 Tax=Deinococcus piscis TaxID=394230 RepID=UPI001E416B54|nr:hypothetical protein [Deinococcus piscis]